MPWKAGSPMEKRAKFVLEMRRDELNMAEIYRRYGISQQTGYKWLERQGGAGVEPKGGSSGESDWGVATA